MLRQDKDLVIFEDQRASGRSRKYYTPLDTQKVSSKASIIFGQDVVFLVSLTILVLHARDKLEMKCYDWRIRLPCNRPQEGRKEEDGKTSVRNWR